MNSINFYTSFISIVFDFIDETKPFIVIEKQATYLSHDLIQMFISSLGRRTVDEAQRS